MKPFVLTALSFYKSKTILDQSKIIFLIFNVILFRYLKTRKSCGWWRCHLWKMIVQYFLDQFKFFWTYGRTRHNFCFLFEFSLEFSLFIDKKIWPSPKKFVPVQKKLDQSVYWPIEGPGRTSIFVLSLCK